jgi:hypothetical protein
MDAWALKRIAKLYRITVEELHEPLTNSNSLYRRGRQ